MSETSAELLTAVRNYVTDLFTHQVKPEFVFHSLEHTEDVVEASSYMADHYRLNDEDHLVLLLAAWFHDTGYTKGEATGHEDESIKIATAFLNRNNVDETVIQRVGSCIEATRMPQSPVSLIEKILCDADLFHLATDDFKARSQLLRQEQESLLGLKIDKKEWRKNNISFLENHKYFTDYGLEKLEPKKHENLDRLKKKKQVKVVEEKEEKKVAFPYLSEPAATNKEAKEQQKNTERGAQTMFRTTSHNHFELSGLADSKAHIMISVNAIIISVVLTVLLGRIVYERQFIIPTITLLLVSISTIIFAILATRPSISSGKFSEEDIRAKKTNLLFFGNFYRMKLEEYQWGMNEMLKDREYLYNSMIKDIYFLGVVLSKKYRYLRIAYTIFMWGIILSSIAFGIAAIIGSPTAEPGQLIDY
ncbi:DUF5706 domain-containing protein [Chitinophagaceae bacterium LB-8]|uniref:DUF5706 domain-containing protein n=1 Tax=Paraflavisolibacter caeni TaxID=2982496 RepID=A0A9X2XPM4_9BACT|nr:Pycsar system effector family protein [Paraflavisolibacter caeni]MCU7551698.1 DUF5706 domain-containing protein [Paraflavisolibacter caeni]